MDFSKKGVEKKQKALVSKLPEINENYRFRCSKHYWSYSLRSSYLESVPVLVC